MVVIPLMNTLNIDRIRAISPEDINSNSPNDKFPIKLLRKSIYELPTNNSPITRNIFDKLERSRLVGPYKESPKGYMDMVEGINHSELNWMVPIPHLLSPDTEFVHMTLVKLVTVYDQEMLNIINEKMDYKIMSDVIYNALRAIGDEINRLDPNPRNLRGGIVARIDDCIVGFEIKQKPLFPHIDYIVLGPGEKPRDITQSLEIDEIKGMFKESVRDLVLHSYSKEGIAYCPTLTKNIDPRKYDVVDLSRNDKNIVF